MFGLGFTHLAILFLIGLIVLGPEELPKVARTLGRFLNELKRGGDHFRDELNRSVQSLDEKRDIKPPELVAEKTEKPQESTPPQDPSKKDSNG